MKSSLIFFVLVSVLATTAMFGSDAAAVVLDCPPTVRIKADEAPFPWTPSATNAAELRFSQASYSCSNGTCTLSCSYVAPNQAYTLLEYKVPPGTCSYTSDGTAFSCQSIPAPRRHRRHID